MKRKILFSFALLFASVTAKAAVDTEQINTHFQQFQEKYKKAEDELAALKDEIRRIHIEHHLTHTETPKKN